MTIEAESVEEYYEKVPEERKVSILKLRQLLRDNLPEGFSEVLSYGAPGFVVPHSAYPAGYHCNPEEPLPFVTLMNQQKYIAMYHSGLYVDSKLQSWFEKEYPKYSKHKLDMGKSCVRFKYMDDIPYDLIAELARKITVKEWITMYEKSVQR